MLLHLIKIKSNAILSSRLTGLVQAIRVVRFNSQHLIRQPDVLEKKTRQRKGLHAALDVVYLEQTVESPCAKVGAETSGFERIQFAKKELSRLNILFQFCWCFQAYMHAVVLE